MLFVDRLSTTAEFGYDLPASSISITVVSISKLLGMLGIAGGACHPLMAGSLEKSDD